MTSSIPMTWTKMKWGRSNCPSIMIKSWWEATSGILTEPCSVVPWLWYAFCKLNKSGCQKEHKWISTLMWKTLFPFLFELHCKAWQLGDYYGEVGISVIQITAWWLKLWFLVISWWLSGLSSATKVGRDTQYSKAHEIAETPRMISILSMHGSGM